MPYSPNDKNLPINPSMEGLKSLLGVMSGPPATPEQPPQEADSTTPSPQGYMPTIGKTRFEHYPGKIEENLTTLRGIARVLTAEGRRERAIERIERLERRQGVAWFIGNRIVSPRITTSPTEKIGWVGTHKRDDPRYPDDPRPNPYKPATASEKSVDRRLEASTEKISKLRHDSAWLRKSYGASLHKDHYQLSRPERKHMNGVSRSVEKSDKNADRLERKFTATAMSKDRHGRIVDWRLRRARNIANRTNR